MLKKLCKNITSSILLGAITLSMTACSVDMGKNDSTSLTTTQETNKTEEKAKEKANKETLTVMIGSDDGGGVATKTALDKAAELLDVNLEYSIFPADQFLNVLNTKGATGNLDDIIFCSYSLSDLPYTEFAELNGSWVEKISDATKQFTISPADGKTVFAPFGAESNFGLAYNKEVLKKAGIQVPIANYEEFIAACEKIKAIGVTPVYVSAQENWTAQILLLSSFTTTLMKGDLVDQLITNQIKPQDVPEIEKIWSNVLSLKELGYINEDHLSATHDMGKKAIANGEAAFYAVTDGAYGEIKTEYPELIDNVGLTVTPMWDNAEDAFVMANRSSRCIAVSKNSKNLELAKKFVDICITEPVLSTYYELSPGASPYVNLGFDLDMSPWNSEVQGLATTLPSYGDWCNALYNGKPKLNPFFGDFDLRVQSMFAGQTAKGALTEWYNKYSEDAAAKRVEGF
ncbi:ABC transporter substrate-binding protein [Sporanaerobium hydrogeniformans]|uniref:ABC transporter substrate-binding protein n=1 Tax=Sporanaerobium hydrogeniformans TaxID=3072179 RepID=UPI0015D48D63|nr:ABC transporter substrate-binding protein [Sporanaerobium hydrogeniformans]